jgi:hypothetical protein
MIASETTTRTGRSAGRIGLIVTGALAGALALGLLAGGGLAVAGAAVAIFHGRRGQSAH